MVIVSYSYEKLQRTLKMAVSSFSVDTLARRVSHNSADSCPQMAVLPAAPMFEALWPILDLL
jgi:hypothetical protein